MLRPFSLGRRAMDRAAIGADGRGVPIARVCPRSDRTLEEGFHVVCDTSRSGTKTKKRRKKIPNH